MAEQIDREIGHSAVAEALQSYFRMHNLLANCPCPLCDAARAALSLARGERQEPSCLTQQMRERYGIPDEPEYVRRERMADNLGITATVQSPGSTLPAPEASMEKGQA